MHRQDGAVAAKLVVGAAESDGAEAQQAQRTSAHDAGLAGDVKVAPARRRGTRMYWWGRAGLQRCRAVQPRMHHLACPDWQLQQWTVSREPGHAALTHSWNRAAARSPPASASRESTAMNSACRVPCRVPRSRKSQHASNGAIAADGDCGGHTGPACEQEAASRHLCLG